MRLAGGRFSPKQQRGFAVFRRQPGDESGHGFTIATDDEVVEAGWRFRQEVEEQLAHGKQGCGVQSGTAWAARKAVISDKIPSFPEEVAHFITTARPSSVSLPRFS